MINLIVAVDKNNGIGKDNQLPWGRIKEDMKYFKNNTMNHTVVMGRKTYESIGKPLPNRRNIVLSKTLNNIDGVEVVNSMKDIFRIHAKNPNDDIFIIGGGSIYKSFMEIADRVYITYIDGEFDCDTYFCLDESKWTDVYKNHIETEPYNLCFCIKDRRRK